MTVTTKRTFETSKQLSREIEEVIPGGVNSPFRSFQDVGGHTIFFDRAEGSRLYDVDGNEYIDYLGAWGPAVLGHCHPDVVKAAQLSVAHGAVFGAPCRTELEMAKALRKLLPSMQKIRFVNSGTEAVMSAIRLARGFTGRDLIIMFEGGYHGHSDSVLGSKTHFASAGVPYATASNTLLVPYNDKAALARTLAEYAKKVAAVIIEPVCGSIGVVPPADGYLQDVAALCRENEALLIFDEVLTGLRIARGGAQALYHIEPDLTCLGKALASGMPIGAFGGRGEIMDHLLPLGDVYQAGTFPGNPATMAAGIETLRLLADQKIYDRLELRAAQLFEGLAHAAAGVKRGPLSVQLQRVGSMFAVLFAPHPVRNHKDHLAVNGKRFSRFFHYLLENGVYFPPSAVDAACISAAHSEFDIESTIGICAEAFAAIA